MMTGLNDTIVGAATALSDSGIGIVRISGKDAILLADKVYRSKGASKLADYESHTIHYGFIVDGEEFLDEVMVSVFISPKSYTTEDTVEINCHGGILIIRRVIELMVRLGCRIAEPGEFTKRAFLNGRIDLSRAEAVMDMIHVGNDFALKASVHQLRGGLYRLICGLREEILYEIAFIESALDDPEHISLEGYQKNLNEKISSMIERLNKLFFSFDHGKMLREGIDTVIVGKPNAGKSSLLNCLTGQERAIVTKIAGTTRDIIEERISFHGIGLNLIDTAGLRYTEDEIEKIGVERAKKYALEADLILYLVDSSVVLDGDDDEIIRLIADKKVIILLNKSDLSSVVNEQELRRIFLHCGVNRANIGIENEQIRMIWTSLIDKTGIEELKNAIIEMFFQGKLQGNHEIILTNLRHKNLIKDSLDSLSMVKLGIEENVPEDFLSIDLMDAYASLGKIIGEEAGDDVVNEIFSRFCMGK